MRYTTNGNMVNNDDGVIIATVVGKNRRIGRQCAVILADYLNSDAIAKENAEIQAKIDNLQRIDNVLAEVEERFEGCEI